MSYNNSRISIDRWTTVLVIESGIKILVLNGGAVEIAAGGQFRPASATPRVTNGVQASAIANSVPATIPDPADSPASADALRDDLVANVLPIIRNNLADQAAKINAILVALRGVGIIGS